jgi:hypothetical protein
MASLTCPNCQTAVAADTTTCPSCGNALGAAQATAFSASAPPPPATSYTAGATPPPAAHASGAHAAKPEIKFDWASLSHVDRLVGGGTLVLFISLFLTWFSYAGFGISGLTAHGYLYIVLILAIGIIALIGAETLGVWKLPASATISRDQILLIGTAINFVLVLIAFLLKPGGYGFHGVGWSYGAFIGLIAAVVAAFPLGWPIIQARRGKS